MCITQLRLVLSKSPVSWTPTSLAHFLFLISTSSPILILCWLRCFFSPALQLRNRCWNSPVVFSFYQACLFLITYPQIPWSRCGAKPQKILFAFAGVVPHPKCPCLFQNLVKSLTKLQAFSFPQIFPSLPALKHLFPSKQWTVLRWRMVTLTTHCFIMLHLHIFLLHLIVSH